MAFASLEGYNVQWRRSRNRNALTLQIRQPGTTFDSTHGLIAESDLQTCEHWGHEQITQFAIQKAEGMLAKVRAIVTSRPATCLPMWFA